MKIYFAGSITGGRDDARVYSKIIEYLKCFGEVLTEHVGSKKISSMGEDNGYFIHDRDMNWLLDADVIVAEVTTPSLGVGYEIGRAIENHKKVLCLYRPQEEKRLSAMIRGCKDLTVIEYKDFASVKEKVAEFLSK